MKEMKICRARMSERPFHIMCHDAVYITSSSDSGSDDRSEDSLDLDEKRKRAPPRVLKRDVRRNYALMFVNALNSYDIPLLYKFMKQHCTRNVSLYQECPGVHNPPYVFLRGNDLIGLHWSWKMRLLPDMAIRIKQAKICVRNDTGRSKVMAELEIMGTKLHDYPLHEMLPKLRTLECADVATDVSANPMDEILHNETVCVDSRHNYDKMGSLTHYMPMTTPIDVLISGIMTFYIDEDKRIDGLEFKLNAEMSRLMFNYSVLESPV